MTDVKTGKLNFRGDIRHADSSVVGPDTEMRMFFPVAAEYDENTNLTTIFYTTGANNG